MSRHICHENEPKFSFPIQIFLLVVSSCIRIVFVHCMMVWFWQFCVAPVLGRSIRSSEFLLFIVLAKFVVGSVGVSSGGHLQSGQYLSFCLH
jgi:hypothetical protein